MSWLPWTDGNYEVADTGAIRNRKTGKVLRGGRDRNGYHFVLLSTDEGIKNVKVHRAVALSFLPPEPGKEYVQHIDGNRSNNDVTNLRWVSASDKNRRKKI